MTRLQRRYLRLMGGLPLMVAALLAFLRWDLIRPMMQHVFGLGALALFLFFWLGGVGLAWFVFSRVNVAMPADAAGNLKRQTWPVTVTTFASVLFCTTPAVVIALFGPIVFAFMYGEAR